MSIGKFTRKFLRSHPITAAWEGGWSNHPDDRGGKTMFGITEALWVSFRKKMGLPAKPIRSVTRSEAEALFFTEFWLKAGCESLADGVDLATYDASVNSGVSRGRKWLLASIGGTNAETVKRLCAKRLSFVQALASWRSFGKGWSNRIADIQAKGVALALAASSDTIIVSEQLRDEASIKKTIATRQTAGAGTGAVGTGSVTAQQSTQAADWLLSGLGVLMAAAVCYLIWRALLNRTQATAFTREAEAMS